MMLGLVHAQKSFMGAEVGLESPFPLVLQSLEKVQKLLGAADTWDCLWQCCALRAPMTGLELQRCILGTPIS